MNKEKPRTPGRAHQATEQNTIEQKPRPTAWRHPSRTAQNSTNSTPKKRPDAWRPSRPATWHDCTKCTPQKSDGQAGRQKNTRKRGKKGGFFVFCRFAVQITVFWDRRAKRRFFGLSGLIVLTNQNRPPTPARTGSHHARQPSPTTRARAGKNLIELRANSEKTPPAASVSK